VKVVSSLQAGKLEEFEALLETAAETSPAPGAVTLWATCVATGIFLFDLLGRSPAATHLLEKLASGVRAGGEQEPIALTILQAILAVRTTYADEDPMKGLEHAETLLHLAQTTGQRRYIAFAKNLIGMTRWCLGILGGTDRILLEIAVSDSDTGLASSYRPFVLAWLLADRDSLEEARVWADRLVEAGQTRRLPVDEARGHWVRAEVLRRAGDLEGADAAIEAAL